MRFGKTWFNFCGSGFCIEAAALYDLLLIMLYKLVNALQLQDRYAALLRDKELSYFGLTNISFLGVSLQFLELERQVTGFYDMVFGPRKTKLAWMQMLQKICMIMYRIIYI